MKLITLINSVGRLQVECFKWAAPTTVRYLCPITEYCCEGGCCIDDAVETRLRWIAGLFLVVLLIVVLMYGLHRISAMSKLVSGIKGPRDVLIQLSQRPEPACSKEVVNNNSSCNYEYDER